MKNRKEELVDICEKLFKQKGFLNTTIDDITKKTKLSKGGLYYYFESKEDILHNIIEKYISKSLIEVHKYADDDKLNALEKLQYIINKALPVEEDEDAILLDFYRMVNKNLFYKKVELEIKNLTGVFSKIIIKGMESGLFNKNDRIKETVEIFIMMMQNTDMLILNNIDKADDYKRASRRLLEYFLGLKDGELDLIKNEIK